MGSIPNPTSGPEQVLASEEVDVAIIGGKHYYSSLVTMTRVELVT